MLPEFLAAALLIELTPGPNMAWLALLGASRGRIVALAAVAGVALGLSIAGAAAAFGVSALIGTTPWLFQALRWAGSLYLLYLAWDSWRDSTAPQETQFDDPLWRYFGQGLLSNMLNPKAYLVFAAVLPQFVNPAQPLLTQLVTLSALYVGGCNRSSCSHRHSGRELQSFFCRPVAGAYTWSRICSAARCSCHLVLLRNGNEIMSVIIAMWSGPRNISTAMMYSFGNRADCVAWDEPFYAFSLVNHGNDHPMRDEIIAANESDWDVLVAKCTTPAAKSVFYQKHMTHHMLPGFDRSWVHKLTNAFLIRSPERVLASYTKKWADVSLRDIGFVEQAEIFDAVAQKQGYAPPVIDADDVLKNPKGFSPHSARHAAFPFLKPC